MNNIPTELSPATGVKVIAAVIQEIENNTVTWQWDSSDYPELYSESVEGNDFANINTPHDYLHLNSMTIDPKDNNLVCSFRHANLIMKINRINSNIVWKLGGKNSSFPMTENMKFLRQHHATFTDNDSTLLLFDNGLTGVRESSRILEFQLNENGEVINSFKAFNIPEEFSPTMGSVQKIGDRYFIGGGSAKYILEVNYNTGVETFKMQLAENSYRTFKY